MQILKLDGLVTWTLRSLGSSDQIIVPSLPASLDGSTYIKFGLLVRISCTFLLESFCSFLTIEIIRMDSPGSKNCFLMRS